MNRWTSLLVLAPAALLSAATCDKAATPQEPPKPAGEAPAPAAEPKGSALAGKVVSDVPGMDFSVLGPAAQRELATVFTDEFCYCGCPHTLGACLKQHQGCRHARRMATLAAAEASAGTPATEIILQLSRYYASLGEKRQAFKVDDRLCQGKKDAKVTVVEFSDFECPYCAAARPMLSKLVAGRPEVRLCYLPYPLPAHPNAMKAAQAALFARDRGKFWPMHDAMFESQADLGIARLKELAQKIGLPPDELGKALESGKYSEELDASRAWGKAAGVDATPALFVNGRKLGLGLTVETLSHAVDDELEWVRGGNAWAAD